MSLLTMGFTAATKPKTWVDDAFSAFTYMGNGTSRYIENGVDLATYGGMVWIKNRGSTSNHLIYDTTLGVGKVIPLTTAGSSVFPGVGSFTNAGFTLGTGSNDSGTPFVSWTFRKAYKFFDVVKYIGDGTYGRNIPHALGIAPGFIIIKRTDTTGDWHVIFRNNAGNYVMNMKLNTQIASSTYSAAGNNYWTSTGLNLSGMMSNAGNDPAVRDLLNASGGTFVAYMFAHDPDADGMIKCGSFTTDATANASVTLDWEPQFIFTKSTNGTGFIMDSARGMTSTLTGSGVILYPESAAADSTFPCARPNATGFTILGTDGNYTASTEFFYVAIRRKNKPLIR